MIYSDAQAESGPWGTPPSDDDGNKPSNPWGSGPTSINGGKSGRGGSGGGGGSRGRGPNEPDFDEMFKKGQEQLKALMPKGFGPTFILLLALVLGGWLLTGFYRVGPDEQGVVLRFGKLSRTEQQGLRYHLPAPIEEVYLPKVTRVNRIEVGYKSVGDGNKLAVADVPEESLMLTGDENIIDIDFSVFWLIKDAGQYLFQIRDPEGTVKHASESAMREVIGQTKIQPALTEARQQIETRTQEILQKMLDEYKSGIQVSQVQLQKVDPPTAVIDAFNDVQRARADRERLSNEAEAYRNSIVPIARGEAQQLIQGASGYREKVINIATGDAQRFKNVFDAYNVSRTVTVNRLYLETLEEIFAKTPKIIIDKSASGSGVMPYLPLDQLKPKQATEQQSQAGEVK